MAMQLILGVRFAAGLLVVDSWVYRMLPADQGTGR